VQKDPHKDFALGLCFSFQDRADVDGFETPLELDSVRILSRVFSIGRPTPSNLTCRVDIPKGPNIRLFPLLTVHGKIL
jgi:hypothetical protein